MDKKRIAVLGVVFPKIERFIDDYLSSLEKQTVKDFDLIIINDGFNNFIRFKTQYDLNIKDVKYTGTPAEIREFAINYLKKEKYDYVIFTDCDDFFSSNRVEKSLELLKSYDIVVNDLTTISECGEVIKSCYISNRFDNLSEIELDYIIDKNIFGLSNTAVKLRSFPEEIRFERDLVAIDWYFYSKLLAGGCKAVFTGEAVTFYRIHNENTVGLGGLPGRSQIEKGIKIKLSHYKALSNKDTRMRDLFIKYSELCSAMSAPHFKEKYCQMIEKNSIFYPLWWEQIKLPEDLNESKAVTQQRGL